MKICPRCTLKTLHDDQVMNNLSRRDNKTYICNVCGKQEAFIDGGFKAADATERNFVAGLKIK